jgi:hypothetical protein
MVFKVSPPIERGARWIILGGDGKRSRILLGRLAEFGPQKDVWLDLDREHVIAIVGKRGSGKTHTLGVLVEGLSSAVQDDRLKRSDPANQRAVIVFDTLNLFQWIDLPLETANGPQAVQQRKDLASWKLDAQTIAPTFWHPSGSEPATSKSSAFSIRPADMDAQDWGRLLNLDIVAEPMGQLLAETYGRVQQKAHPNGTLDRNYTIDDMVSVLRRDPSIQADYAPETIRAVRQRLTTWARSPLFDSNKPDWVSALQRGQTAVFLLGRVPEDLRSALVFLVIRRLLEARSAASEAAKHALLTGTQPPNDTVPPAWVVIDESQNILPSRDSTSANDILTRFVREGRNFGLSLAVTAQQPMSIDARVMAQVDTLIAHTLTVRGDVNYVMANLKSAEPQSIKIGSRAVLLGDSLRLLSPGQCLISAVESPRLVYCEVRPRLTLHGGFEG